MKYIATAEFDEKKKVTAIQTLEESYKSRLADLEEVYAEELESAK